MQRKTPTSLGAARRAALVFALVPSLLGTLPPAAGADAGTSYYVDAVRGDDGSTGRSPATAWRSLDRVNATTFEPGDRILLRSGRSWQGQLWPKGSGSSGRPITVDRYGPGAEPAVHGGGAVADAVRLFNQHHWRIRNLEVANTAPPADVPGANLRDLRGIHVRGDADGRLDYFRIDSVDVHDVSGEVNWIGGNTSGNAPGTTFRTGWDRSKNTGGIVFRGTVADETAPGAPTILNDIVVQNSTVERTSFGGIIVKQHTGSDPGAVHTGWGERANRDDPNFTPHTNVVIRDNFVSQDGTPHGCDGIYLTDVRGGLVERNVVHRTGTSGIEAYYADDITVQHNEVHETQQKAGGADSNGIDPDIATTNVLVQYNFVHHNGDGILLCQCGRGFGDTRVRYNVIASNTLSTSATVDYESNVYGSATLSVPADDTRALVGDPLFLGTITGPYGTERSGPRLDRALPLRVAADSPAVDAGRDVPDSGGVDYRGRRVNGLPDIGAFERSAAVQH